MVNNGAVLLTHCERDNSKRVCVSACLRVRVRVRVRVCVCVWVGAWGGGGEVDREET